MTQRELSALRTLAVRIRREYEEMPGLHLTLQQACRLWGLGPETCAALLDGLVEDGFLTRTRRGAFARA